ncbi:MAG: hypothetical protein WCA20_04925 [Candidatus Sulfotelmatobacter sp.]
MIDALLQSGQEQHVPIGIEYIDAAAFRNRITLHVRNSTMGRLLDAITHGQSYRWFIQDGVVMVTHDAAPQGRKNLLNTRIPEFTIEKEITLQAASLNFVTVKALISMMIAITIQSHPTKRKTVRNALCKGAPRFEALTAVETFG